MTGTIINTLTVLVGSALGVLLGRRFPDNTRETVLTGLGLVTLVVGLQMTWDTANVLIVMASILLGAVLGEWWRIEDHLQALGQALEHRVGGREQAGRLAQGFVTASLIFCVGPMTVVGALRDGLTGDYTLLAIKSLLDGFTSLALASSLGIGVMFSAVTVLVFQGALAMLARLAGMAMSPAMITEMAATGGVIILGIGLLLLDVKRVRVGNLLPAIIIAPLIVAILTALSIPLAP